MLVEQARLRVGELREWMPDDSPQQLDAVERELGMVGYLVSENLVAEARRELLAQARRSCRAAASDRDAAWAELSQLLAGLDRELGCAVAVRAHAAHASQAADHLADVRELLADVLGEPQAHTSASTDGRAAHTGTSHRHHVTPTGTSD